MPHTVLIEAAVAVALLVLSEQLRRISNRLVRIEDKENRIVADVTQALSDVELGTNRLLAAIASAVTDLRNGAVPQEIADRLEVVAGKVNAGADDLQAADPTP